MLVNATYVMMVSTIDHLAPVAHLPAEPTWGWWNCTVGAVRRWTHTALVLVVQRPLAHLYLHGPSVLGFWGGVEPETVCARLTGTNPSHWVSTPDNLHECYDIIDRNFRSWMVLATTVAYFVCALTAVWLVYQRCCGRRRYYPMLPQQPNIIVVPSLDYLKQHRPRHVEEVD